MMFLRSSLSLLLASIPLLSVSQGQQVLPCPCRFNVPAQNEAGCAVYGQLGDGRLIAWERASQDCLDDLKIKQQAVDSGTLFSFCGTEPGASLDEQNSVEFVNFIRFDGSEAATGIALSFPQFFQPATGTVGGYELVVTLDDFNSPGVTYFCETQTQQCWQVVRDYFAANLGEIQAVCVDLFSRQANAQELEQSAVRIRICQENGEEIPSDTCEPLKGQVLGVMESLDEVKACSAFGLGPATAELPSDATCSYTSEAFGPIGEEPEKPTPAPPPEKDRFDTGSVKGFSSGQTVPCPCTFEVPAEDEKGCAVYGQLGDGELIPWHRASENCLKDLNISKEAVDGDILFLICNNATASGLSDANAGAFINFLRHDGSAAARGIALSFPQFFQEMPTGEVDLAPNITVGFGKTVDCETTASLCWNEIKIYFTAQTNEIKAVCLDLFPQQINAIDLEQSAARIRICQDGAESPNNCGQLKTQVMEFSASTGDDIACSAFGLGPATAKLPDNETCSLDVVPGDGTSDGRTTAMWHTALMTMMTALWVCLSF